MPRRADDGANRKFLSLRHPKPTQPLTEQYRGIYGSPGGLWVQCDSEDIDRAHNSGLRWVLIQAFTGEEWLPITSKCERLNIPWGWWFHCRDPQDLENLMVVSVGRPLCGINIEQELDTTLPPAVINQAISDHDYQGDPSIITLGWVPNNTRVTGAVADIPWLLEMFPQDAPALWPPYATYPDCKQHAHTLGVRHPMQLAGCYSSPQTGPAQPGWYDRSTLTHLYPANNLQDQWETWLHPHTQT